jgi:hypothetical protein
MATGPVLIFSDWSVQPLNDMDSDKADGASCNPALRYGFSLLDGLVIIYSDVDLLFRYQKVCQFYCSCVEDWSKKPCLESVLKIISTNKKILFILGDQEK